MITYLICAGISILVAIILYFIITKKVVDVEVLEQDTIKLPCWIRGRVKVVKRRNKRFDRTSYTDRLIIYQVEKRTRMRHNSYWETKAKITVNTI